MRFPDVDWWCDECIASLNDQPGFTDENDEWTCTECGHVTRITSNNLMSDEVAAESAEWLSKFDAKDYPLPG